MTPTRPGADRINRQMIQASAIAAERALRVHKRQCITCTRSDGDPYACCNTWWQLSIEAHKRRRQLRIYDTPHADNTGELF